MKVMVDISVISAVSGVLGNLTGAIEVETPPSLGDTLSFMFPQKNVPIGQSGFSGLLKVTDRILSVNIPSGGLAVALSDIVVDSLEDALTVAKYLEEGFGLYLTRYSE